MITQENFCFDLFESQTHSCYFSPLGLIGMTTITEPEAPIPYHSTISITCHTSQSLTNPKWFFQQNAKPILEVTNGTEANVTSDTSSTTVSINKTSEAWKGMFLKIECMTKVAVIMIILSI